MYVPPSFAVSDEDAVFDFVRQNPFATLVSSQGTELTASHIPFLIERQSDQTVLLGHVARANPQWKAAAGQAVLTIFQGPHVYISPAWYESDNVVPTWNYQAVHAYGTLELIDNREHLLEVLVRSIETFESYRDLPWSLDANDPEFVDELLKGIVGFRIPIDRLQAKWKLQQNHSEERRRKVITALDKQADENSRMIAAQIKTTLDK
ncbi:MAG: FMN-binding negative transcriptional regulator [Pirellulaceae bacterium]|jgi:transcriptional regulator|nr:FMN-binding negative transcriptional regulator [Planctomycetaceae bacterium]